MNINEIYEKAKKLVDLEDSGPVPFVVSTGSVLVDQASGIGGLPGGRFIEIYGPESSGKTTLALHAMANAQKMELPVAMIDAEHAFDESYAKAIGLSGERNMDWFYGAPDTTEQTIELIELLIVEGFKLIVVDSVASMIPKAELEGEVGESVMGLQARLMSGACRRLVGQVSKQGVLVIFINQLRSKIGVVFGSPEVTTGGNALKFYASMRIDMRAVGDKIKVKDQEIGQFRKVTFKKNKLAPPLKIVMAPIKYGVGFWAGAEILDMLLTKKIVTKKSSYFYYGEDVLGAGKANAVSAIEEDIEYFRSLANGGEDA